MKNTHNCLETVFCALTISINDPSNSSGHTSSDLSLLLVSTWRKPVLPAACSRRCIYSTDSSFQVELEIRLYVTNLIFVLSKAELGRSSFHFPRGYYDDPL